MRRRLAHRLRCRMSSRRCGAVGMKAVAVAASTCKYHVAAASKTLTPTSFTILKHCPDFFNWPSSFVIGSDNYIVFSQQNYMGGGMAPGKWKGTDAAFVVHS